MISRSLKSFVLLFILAISAAGIQLCLDGKIFAASQDNFNHEISDGIKEETGEEAGDVSEDIMEEIMEEIMDDVSEEINNSIKEEVRQDTTEVVSEETTSPFSGTYVSGPFLTFQYVISGSSFQATGSNEAGTLFITLSGTIEGNMTSFTATRTELAPPCTESGSATGVFSGSGEPGTTHTIMPAFICNQPPGTVVHTKQ